MRIISLNYHDVVTRGDPEPTGRSAPGAWRYNLERDEFVGHLKAIAEARTTGPVTAFDAADTRNNPWPLVLTFDDGGASAYKCTADILERFGWRGHFFVSTNYIGTPGFVSSAQILALRKRGHVIGSHSCSHPERMSHYSWAQLIEEWTRSVSVLSDIVGEQVSVASVPGGYYSRRVAQAASAAGIKILFNSEPVTTCQYVDECLVLGRYTVYNGMPAAVVAAIAAGRPVPRLKQLLFWKVKELGKRVGGESYLTVRRQIVAHGWNGPRHVNTKRLSASR